MILSEGGAVPAPHCALGVGKFGVCAVGWDAESSLNFGAKVLAHRLSFVGAHCADAFNLDVAGGIARATKSHSGTRLKSGHHIRLKFA